MHDTNHLIHETSPYLLQHAKNPVNWYPWCDEALTKAKKENKPILVSIGYAACHWCHVMEKESFEDEQTAAIMNEHFVNIKIDREERPDLDHIYMDAVQAMTGSGGWPLNVFLTPDKKPFFGGTYFPPQRAYNRPSWKEILYSITEAFKKRRHEIDSQAENLTDHLLKSNEFGKSLAEQKDNTLSQQMIDDAYGNIMKSADREWGGFSRAPKFPNTFTIRFLLRYYYFSGDKDALLQATLSLDKMIEGGIYDQLGGGFARYSTDTEWLLPHFEKMLYDNALLITVLSEAYQLTGKERYREIIFETFTFIERELLHPLKGFYSALDADSEGVEGKFYVWSRKEINKLLGKDSEVFCDYFDITENGNWEKTNILRIKEPLTKFARDRNIDISDLKSTIDKCKKILLEERNKRIHPLLDDKIILGWNALMNTACSKAFAATGNEKYRKLAIENMNFLLTAFRKGDENEFFHTWKDNISKYPAFLDDYAFVIEALINLQEITGDKKWLTKAIELSACVIRDFSENETGFFYYTTITQQDVIIRKKEIYDGATPSGNAIMATNLLKLAILTDQHEWKKRAEDMVQAVKKAVVSYPTTFGNWLLLTYQMIKGINEIAVIGSDAASIAERILGNYLPHRVLMFSKNEEVGYPLLAGKKSGERTAIYLCSNYTCLNPVFSTEELIGLINKGKND